MSSEISYLIDDRLTLEGELELLERCEKFKGCADFDEEFERYGIKDLNNFEKKFGKSFLKKRIAWYEAEIKKEEKEVA